MRPRNLWVLVVASLAAVRARSARIADLVGPVRPVGNTNYATMDALALEAGLTEEQLQRLWQERPAGMTSMARCYIESQRALRREDQQYIAADLQQLLRSAAHMTPPASAR